jgi:tRNA(adenine34) deaminase
MNLSLPEDDATHMRYAIEASRQAVSAGDMPFGAALVQHGVRLHVARNNQFTRRDVTGHAEVALLREVSDLHGSDTLKGSTVYASGEPCAMCTGALFWAGVGRVVFAATTADIIAALGGPALPIRTSEVLASASPKFAVYGPLLREEAVEVLRSFAQSKAPAR